MTDVQAIALPDPKTMLNLIGGDLKDLNPEQRVAYYTKVCESVGLNYLTQPFNFLNLSGKTVLYANRSASDQLRFIHKVSVTIADRKRESGVYTVLARAQMPDGRIDEATGVVPLGNQSGENLANIYMKAETKALEGVTDEVATRVDTAIRDIRAVLEH